jgi:hypothetical protein
MRTSAAIGVATHTTVGVGSGSANPRQLLSSGCSAETGLLGDWILSLNDRHHRPRFSGIFVPSTIVVWCLARLHNKHSAEMINLRTIGRDDIGTSVHN